MRQLFDLFRVANIPCINNNNNDNNDNDNDDDDDDDNDDDDNESSMGQHKFISFPHNSVDVKLNYKNC